jgi:hypothetical protein
MEIVIQINDPAVQSALISAAGSVVTGVIASICAAVIGKEFADRQRLQDKLRVAEKDIFFLLMVEQAHCEMHHKRDGVSKKISVRRAVRSNGHHWSGKFIPSRLRDK